MPHKYAQLMFTDGVKQAQREMGSRAGYQSMERGEDYNHLLSDNEAQFITERDSFYMASVSETGWPYVQHRGGPAGFMRVLDASTIGFADFSGNRQYVSTGNFRSNNRVSLFFMDYPNQRRLKLSGTIEQVADDDWDALVRLEVEGYPAAVERGFVIHIEAFDWNCPKYITLRYTEQEMSHVITPLLAENRKLKDRQESESDLKTLGDGEWPLIITGVRQLTSRIRAYELRHRDGVDLLEVSAGAHLNIPVVLESGEASERRYSICSNPARRDMYEIAVLRDENGSGGSAAVHNQFHLGLQLNCATPENFFSLHSDARPAVLIAAGIGITPIKAMAQQLDKEGREFFLHYTGSKLSQMAFQERLSKAFPGRIKLYSRETQQRLNVEALLVNAPEDSLFYVCGPQRLLSEMLEVADRLGIDPERIRYEQFSAAKVSGENSFNAKLVQSGVTLQVPENQSLLQVIHDNGIALPSGCETGDCRSCMINYEGSDVEHRDNCLTESERKTLMCPCVSRPQNDLIYLDI